LVGAGDRRLVGTDALQRLERDRAGQSSVDCYVLVYVHTFLCRIKDGQRQLLLLLLLLLKLCAITLIVCGFRNASDRS